MDSEPNNTSVTKGEIRFPNDNRAVFVRAPARTSAIDLIAALEIKKPATVVLLIGGADDLDPKLNARIENLLDQGLALAASDTNALIIDGGTRAGVMALMGKVMALRGRVTCLLGVAPEGKVTYPGGPAEGSITEGAALDPNHSHFVLVEGSKWSDGTEVMFKLVSELAKESRVVVILVNGGDETRAEVLRAAKLGWPVIAIQGSGRLADDVAAQVTFAGQGEFDLFRLEEKPEGLRELIKRHAEGALIEAWTRFRQYDSTAMVNKSTHERMLTFTLMIGVLGTLFALAQKQFTLDGKYYGFVFASSLGLAAVPVLLMIAVASLQIFRPKRQELLTYSWWVAGSASGVLLIVAAFRPLGFLRTAVFVFQYLAVATPIIVSILVAGSNRFKNRRKWILLRGSAEAIKKEIFRYRTRVGDYADQVLSEKEDPKEPATKPHRSRDVALRDNIVRITQRVMQTEVNTGSFIYDDQQSPGHARTGDDGFSFLTPERYLEVRLLDQMTWYEGKTAGLERQRSEFQWLIYIVGGGGSLLAALGAQLWVALTTATITALTAWVADLKLDVNLVKYNQAAAELRNLQYWWSTLSSEEKASLENRESLVNTTEQILETERANWVEQMESATKEVTETTGEKTKP